MTGVGNRQLFWLVVALGTTQIVSWGQLFYSMAVLWPAISQDLGISRTMTFTVVSASLLVNGLCSPLAGRAIDVTNGRRMMCIGSLIAALGFLILANASSLPLYVLGWLLGGVAMSLTMYDPAFATLSQHAGDRYRRAMTAVTLVGGFAGTVFWPLTSWLLTNWGWRGAFYSFVVMQLLICLPLHWFLIPKRQSSDQKEGAPVASKLVPKATPAQARIYRWIVAAFCLHAYVMAVNAVHLLSILQERGLTLNEAVTVGMVIGPMQVAGRIVDMSIGGGIAPRLLGTVALALMTASMLLLALPGLDYAIAFLVAGLWGSGNGLVTILKGVSIAQIFGRNDYGAWMGRLARWNYVVHSIAPASFAYLLSVGLGYDKVGWLLGLFTATALVCYYIALRNVPKEI